MDESIEESNSLNLDSLKEQLNNLDIDEDFYDDIINMALDYKDEDISETEILRDIFERDILVTNKGLNGKVVLVGTYRCRKDNYNCKTCWQTCTC